MKGRRHSQFKKMLIGFDGSPQAEKATEGALALARPLDAKALLVAVARPPEPATIIKVDAMLDDARGQLDSSSPIEDYIAGIRSKLIRVLSDQGMAKEPPSIPASHAKFEAARKAIYAGARKIARPSISMRRQEAAC